MKNQALLYYLHDGPTSFRFELKGFLSHEGAQRLDRDWATASSTAGDRRLIVDITFVTGVDQQGHALIGRWHREGAWIVAKSKAARALAESILGEPLPQPSPEAAPPLDRGRLPFRGSLLARSLAMVLLAMIVFPMEANAASLKPATVAAWNDYVQTADANLHDRVRPGGSFLWTLEDPERAAQVRGGEIVVAPAPGQNPTKVPGGLIHHWMGAAFVRNRKLSDVLEVTRDYDHYKEFYRPSVIESKAIARSGSEDRFSMLLMNKAFFMKTALDADYDATNVHFDERRFYSVSTTIRVQEVENVGQPGERRKPDGQGSGYIWRMHSIARLEECEQGVYVELEAIALSRDVPAALRFVVDPIVRRVSRNSLLLSLQQTEQAVGNRSSGARASAEQPGGVAESASDKRSPSRGER